MTLTHIILKVNIRRRESRHRHRSVIYKSQVTEASGALHSQLSGPATKLG
jgi:hypothetical protein